MEGLRAKKRRKELKLSAQDIADTLGTSRVTVSRWEAGISEPDDKTKLALAKVLGTSVAYLMGETDNPVVILNEASEQAQAENQMKLQDISYWGNFLENVQKIAKGGNMAEISSVKSFLKSAFSLLAIGEAQALHVADTKVNTEKNRSMSVTQHHNQNAMVTVNK